MSQLEALQPNAAVRGILPDALVTVVSVQWFGSEALELTYKNPAGRVANELLYRHDEARLDVVEQGRPWSFDGDSHLFRLVSEAHRIRLSGQEALAVRASKKLRTRRPARHQLWGYGPAPGNGPRAAVAWQPRCRGHQRRALSCDRDGPGPVARP